VTQLREIFDEAASSAPPVRYTAEVVFAAGRRRRFLIAATRTAAAVLAVSAVGSAAYTTALPHRPGVGAGDGTGTQAFITALAIDGRHMYAMLRGCPTVQPDPSDDPSASPSPAGTDGPCRIRYLLSTDGGRTWTERPRPGGIDGLALVRPGVLVAGVNRSDGSDAPDRYSVDGGQTWRAIAKGDETVAAVPAGGWLMTYNPTGSYDDAGPLYGVDPRTGRAARLANQPPFPIRGGVAPYSPGGIIVATGGTAFAVSTDGGRTWSTHPLPDAGRETPPYPLTVDGVHLYAFSANSDNAGARYLVSDDGGVTWSPQRSLPGTMFSGAYVVKDGSFVVAVKDGTRTAFWVTRDNGAHFEPVAGMRGLPSAFAGIVSGRPDGSYLARSLAPSNSFYRSTDGWTWTKVTIR
jgi:BNR/Asp-box repeat